MNENQSRDLQEQLPNHPHSEHKQNPRLSFLNQKRYRLLLLLSGGVLTAITLVLTNLWLLEWIALIPAGLVVLYLSDANSLRLRGYYGYGLLFFWSYYIIVFHWFVSMYPLSFTGLSPSAAVFVVIIAVFGLSFLQALISAVAFVLYGLAVKAPWVSRYPFLRPFLFAACWVIFEWFQTFGWWGVPWGRLALGQVESLINIQTAQWFGSYFVSFLIISVGLCLAYALLYVNQKRLAVLTACGIFLTNFLCGAFLLLTYRDEGKTVRVAAIQGNIENQQVFDFSEIKEVYKKYTLLSAEAGADIIIWSETSLPTDLNQSRSLMKYVKELAAEADALLLVGAIRSEKDEDGELHHYNSLYAIASDGSLYDTYYDKQRLVPFGEFVPLRELVSVIFPPLSEIGMLENDFSSGEHGKNISTDFGELGCMICFDSIFESISLGAVQNGAELLCLSSNDAWFLDSAAIYMHHDQARLRAIETGRYLVRSGNSGITSVISPTGEVLEALEPLTEGYVVSDVYLRTDRTLYSVVGNLFVYLLIVFVIAIYASSAYFMLRNAVNKRKNS